MGGVIIATNVRTLLRSDWIAASSALSTVVYVAVYALWAAALTYSIREHLKEKAALPAPGGGTENGATGHDEPALAEPAAATPRGQTLSTTTVIVARHRRGRRRAR
ncbi:hypothetical protein ACF1HJ_00885 [Streptomyces sp. NPDC013978]|uniref:hypothetical protein n=1 Tax=Streptomyces sp. NPDC013978 TaxID=3364869 RepID=UPI0036FD3864